MRVLFWHACKALGASPCCSLLSAERHSCTQDASCPPSVHPTTTQAHSLLLSIDCPHHHFLLGLTATAEMACMAGSAMYFICTGMPNSQTCRAQRSRAERGSNPVQN